MASSHSKQSMGRCDAGDPRSCINLTHDERTWQSGYFCKCLIRLDMLHMVMAGEHVNNWRRKWAVHLEKWIRQLMKCCQQSCAIIVRHVSVRLSEYFHTIWCTYSKNIIIQYRLYLLSCSTFVRKSLQVIIIYP